MPSHATSAVHLPFDAATAYWGRLPCATDAPALTVDSGTTVVLETLSHEGILADQGSDPVAFFARHGVAREQVLDDAVAMAARPDQRTDGDGPHVVTPPVRIRSAQPGDVLAVSVLDLQRRVPYGVVSNRHARGALPGELPVDGVTFSAFAAVDESGDRPEGVLARRTADHGTGSSPLDLPRAATVRFPLSPFLGIMGVAVAGSQRPHSVPPGAHGGNIDINLLGVGATLYLPVLAPGALFYAGDPHFAQGDGEVALTAMEASLRATLRLDVLSAGEVAEHFGELAGPVAETEEWLVPTGMDEDLDVAVANCVRAALGLLQVRYGMDRAMAYAYLSAATDFDISQVVDLVKGVHARIRKADFG